MTVTNTTLGEISQTDRAPKETLPSGGAGVGERGRRIYLNVEDWIRRNPTRSRADAFRALNMSNSEQAMFYQARRKLEVATSYTPAPPREKAPLEAAPPPSDDDAPAKTNLAPELERAWQRLVKESDEKAPDDDATQIAAAAENARELRREKLEEKPSGYQESGREERTPERVAPARERFHAKVGEMTKPTEEQPQDETDILVAVIRAMEKAPERSRSRILAAAGVQLGVPGAAYLVEAR